MIVSKLMKLMTKKGFYYLDGVSNSKGYTRLHFSTMYNGRGDWFECEGPMSDGLIHCSYGIRYPDNGKTRKSGFMKLEAIYVINWVKQQL